MDKAALDSPFEKAPKRDWQLSDDYNYLLALDGRQLAWEFLRRSLRYQEAYADWWALHIQAQANRHEAQGAALAQQAAKSMAAVCERWQIIRTHGPHHPDSHLAPHFVEPTSAGYRLPDSGGEWFEGQYCGIGWGPLHHHTAIAVRLYYDLPLEQQLDEVRFMFERFRKQWDLPEVSTPTGQDKRPRGSLHSTYIRLLDATNDGATNIEIAEAFLPTELAHRRKQTLQKVHDMKASAFEIADHGYIDIFLSSVRK